MKLSIVIPTLNVAERLNTDWGDGVELVIADGGSTDATRRIAGAAGAVVVEAPRGRGSQLAAGAAAAGGDWLLFLHADTRLEDGWRDLAPDPAKAHYFRFALDDDGPDARRLERMVAWRCRTFALPYGDQGLLISRKLYDEIGGFRAMPLMEDVDIVRRLGRHRLVGLDVTAVTSAEKFRRAGYLRRSMKNLFCLGLYFMGVPPRMIERVYR